MLDYLKAFFKIDGTIIPTVFAGWVICIASVSLISEFAGFMTFIVPVVVIILLIIFFETREKYKWFIAQFKKHLAAVRQEKNEDDNA